MFRCLILIVAVLSCTVFGFHLQSDPSIVNQICTTRIQQICNYVGMICRGNQRFDADQPHPVCDYQGRRTQGYPPQQVYQYIMRNQGNQGNQG